jgi:DNA-binding beta-propeller fold protein YncE
MPTMKLARAKRLLIFAIAVAVLLVPVQATADSPMINSSYEGYMYDTLGEPIYSINGYLYDGSIDGYNLTVGAFNSPEDIFVDANDTLYIVDSGNNRIIHMDQEKKVLKVIGDEEGPGKLNTPKGVFVTDEGFVYVADTLNGRVAIFNQEGEFHKEFTAPQSALLGDQFIYSPSKLIIDKRNYMYVVNEGSDKGMMQIDPNGQFRGYYGANHVPFSWSRLFIRFIASKEQRQQLAKVRPPAFSSVYLDKEGFIYTTTMGLRTNQIKRLSAVGVDTLNLAGEENRYGDLYMPRKNWEALYDAFVGITVDDKGIITAIDQTTGKVFQYDSLGNLLFIFGGLGAQNGLFETPAAIKHTSDGTIYVVDKTRGRVDLFTTTPFAEKVHEATALYVDGRYSEAKKPWQEVLEMNANYDLAYRAIGKALEKEERYAEALEYFQKARSRDEYSVTFLDFRKEYMRNHFAEIVTGLILVFLILKFAPRIVRRLAARRLVQKTVDGPRGGAR